MVSGDTAYVGAGIYREVVTVAIAGAVAETKIIGDNSGEFTGDAGEVIWTNYLSGLGNTPSGSDCLNLAGRDFLTFQNLHLIAGGNGNAVDAGTVHSSDIKFTNCVLYGYNASPVSLGVSFATASNFTLERCIVFAMNVVAVSITLTTGVGADYDANIQISDSIIWSIGTAAISIVNSGTAANKGGGVDIQRCTIFGTTGISVTSLQLSQTNPCTFTDNLIYATIAASGGTTGQLVDLGGNVAQGVVSNLTAHASSRIANIPAQIVSLGHEWMWGMLPRRAFSPLFPGALSRGTITNPSTDMEGRPSPDGGSRVIDQGTITTIAATIVTDSTKAWKTNEHVGRLFVQLTGTGAPQIKHIASNTPIQLNIGGVSGDFGPNPSVGSTYMIIEAGATETDQATSGSATTFVVAGAAWSTNQWAGYILEIVSGAQAGQSQLIASNTGTTLTTAAFSGAIDNTSLGRIYWPTAAGISSLLRAPGALQRHDTGVQEPTVVDSGASSLALAGAASHDFLIPVDPVSTTISLKLQFDSEHTGATPPQAILLAAPELGVTTQTVVSGASVNSWGTVTFTAFTPTASGWVTVRIQGRASKPWGRAFADTWSIA